MFPGVVVQVEDVCPAGESFPFIRQSLHRVACAARLLQGLMLDPNKMIPLKKKHTRGHFVRRDFVDCAAALTCLTCPSEKRLNLNMQLLFSCSQEHLRTDTLHYRTDRRGFHGSAAEKHFFSIKHYWRATFIYVITVCFIQTFSC